MKRQDCLISEISYVGFGFGGFEIGFRAYDHYNYMIECDLEYEKPTGMCNYCENIDVPKGASYELLLAKWCFSAITGSPYTTNVCSNLSKMKPQHQFNTLMNQALKASQNVFLFQGRNTLQKLWDEVVALTQAERSRKGELMKHEILRKAEKPTNGCRVVWVAKADGKKWID